MALTEVVLHFRQNFRSIGIASPIATMYYYLDKEDGYSKGPYTWEELKRLPLSPETHIFNQKDLSWQTLESYFVQMAEEAKAKVKPVLRQHTPENYQQPKRKPQEYRPSTTLPESQPYTTAPAPGLPRRFDTSRPMLPGQADDNPMGISGKGCFVLALLIAVVMGLVFVFFL